MTDFIEKIIEQDLGSGKHDTIVTRFPPEPNGYLHIGHAKSICLNFSLAQKYEGRCHLRFDDTNPSKEEQEFVDAIQADVRWLGFDWGQHLYHASDYFEKLYEFATRLIQLDKAYVCELSNEQMREYRGTLQTPGKPSPWRDRPIDESLRLFQAMRAGEFPDGKYVLRAKIDMNSGNINMRDPIIYRIRHVSHQRTGNAWCIYPMYDFTHCLSDALENITHSICTLEFQDHRPLYDWCLETLNTEARPQQIEFARLNLSHTVTSKRKLKQLVEEHHVAGWDDPRLPTLVGLRRRGYPPEAIRKFCETIGISKSDSLIDMSLLEETVRDTLNQSAMRTMCVLRPLKVVIDNYPDDHVESLTSSNHPQKPEMGQRTLAFSKVLYIEADDYMENPPKDYHRLSPGREVRLRNAYVIRADKGIYNDAGELIELRCTVDRDTLGKNPPDRKVKGVIHWVSAAAMERVKVRLFDRLFTVANPGAEDDFLQVINHQSLALVENCYLEKNVVDRCDDAPFQFERQGYFIKDKLASEDAECLVFNRIVTLRDSWK